MTTINIHFFYAIYWPFKHRTLSMRAYRIIIFTLCVLTLFISALFRTTSLLFSFKLSMHYWMPNVLIITFIICSCNIGIWRKFQSGIIASQQQNRNSRNKRLTKTLLFACILALLFWIPFLILNGLIVVCDVQIPWKFYDMVNVINYSNSFANPIIIVHKFVQKHRTHNKLCFKLYLLAAYFKRT